MKNDKKTQKIDISQLLAPILSSRDIISILEETIKKTNTNSIELDFSDVKFVSRSAAHALLLMKEKLQPQWDISFVNTNEDVTNMLRTVAANRAVSKKEKPEYNPERIEANTLFKEVSK